MKKRKDIKGDFTWDDSNLIDREGHQKKLEHRDATMKKMSETRTDGAAVEREVTATHARDVGLVIERNKGIPHVRRRKRTNIRRPRFQPQGLQLLPGIPDDITFGVIAPKLPWKAVHILSSVSSGWRQAILSREVYDARARARSHPTETFVLINFLRVGDGRRIGLFSLRDRKVSLLPPIPGHTMGIPIACQCISLGGKVYVLGGLSPSSRTVYVMDLVGPGHWAQCASMQYERSYAGCGVLNGKIYVFGGGRASCSCVPEVYDPELDVWSPIKSMESMRLQSQVAALGDEILVHGGTVYKQNPVHMCGGPQHVDVPDTYFSAVYNPSLDEWRKADETVDLCEKVLFTAQGKIHTMQEYGTYVYDVSKKSWTHQHSFSLCALISSFGQCVSEPATPLAVDNEVVRVLQFPRKYVFLESRGFGSKSEWIKWRTTVCPFPLGYECFMCIVQL